MKINKLLKNKKATFLVASALVITAVAGGAYYLSTKQDAKLSTENTSTGTTTDSQVKQNVEQKNAAASGEVTTTPSVVAQTPATTSLKDVSLSVYRSDNTAEVSFFGPAGTYGVQKLVGGSWTTLTASFDFSGRGSRGIDTIENAASETHYRIILFESGKQTAISGDTIVYWQQLLNNGGTLSVPLAE